MKLVAIHNMDYPEMMPLSAWYCDHFFCQLRGLTFRRSLPADRGLLLVQKRENRLETSIHMMFVWFDLGVVWINNAMRVVDVKVAKSWHLAYAPQKPAKYILEITPDRIKDFKLGNQIRFDSR